MHLRRKILEELAAQLKTIDKVGRVRNQRIAPKAIQHRDLIIYDQDESTETLLIHPQPREQTRTVNIIVTGFILNQNNDEKVEADLDELALDIENRMQMPADVDDIRLVGTDKTVAEEDPNINMVTLTLHLDYHTTEFDAEI